MMRLLIVEDNYQMRRLLRCIVGGLAEVVCECDDGAEALAAYAAHQPDWVLMDWEMRQMDGLTATRSIRANFPDAHILFVTQYDDRELRAAASEAGACGFFSKDDLLALRSLLEDAKEH